MRSGVSLQLGKHRLLPFASLAFDLCSCCKTLGQFFFHREMSVSSQPLLWLTATIKTLREREQELSSLVLWLNTTLKPTAGWQKCPIKTVLKQKTFHYIAEPIFCSKVSFDFQFCSILFQNYLTLQYIFFWLVCMAFF